MVVFRIKWRSHLVVLLMVMVAGVGILILQRHVFSFLSRHQTAVQRLREEAALAQRERPHGDGLSGTKVILMHSFPRWYELGSGPRVFSSCNRSCTLTLDAQLLQDVDCVVVYVRHFKGRMHPTSSASQVWVYFAVESPFNSDSDVFGTPEWEHRFNWTMTYRRDSEFYFGYGDIIRPSSAPRARSFSPVVKNKTKMVAWFVSNCKTQSKREDFVSALREFVDVDVYGACGQFKCEKEGNRACIDMLSRDYFFYLSFENSMCKDYVTEKLYRTLKMADVVPIVRGGANYSAVLPKDSFIDVSQFPTVKALAEHLKKVAGDPELYEQHLAWKNTFQVIEPMPFSFCDLCYRLHHADRWAHTYPNVEKWWHQDICYDPPAVIKS